MVRDGTEVLQCAGVANSDTDLCGPQAWIGAFEQILVNDNLDLPYISCKRGF